MSEVSKTQIAIIGAGLAGLHAAYRLQAAGIDFVLIEARDRLGGRIFTVNETGEPDPDGFDLGPSWFWPNMQPAIGSLVEELGLPAFCQNSEGDVVFERMSREPPHRYRGGPQEPCSMRLVGGTGALAQALSATLPPDRVHMAVRVTRMSLADNAVALTLEGAGGGTDTLRAEQVIAALPPRLLAANMTFTPALPEAVLARWRETPTWMAPHAKFFAIYDRPFWRDAGLSGTAQSMVGPMAEIHDATTASGKAALFGFVGIPAGQRAAMAEAAVRRACLDQFVRIFGEAARTLRATLFKDWAADELTATLADHMDGGHPAPGREGWVSGEWAPYLELAGSETGVSEAGYLAGAVTAGRRAADTALVKVKDRTRNG